VKQNAIYVGTGNSYSFPAVKTTDAIIGDGIKTKKIRWVRQMTQGDVWNGGCRGGDPVVCSEDAPDYDFAASPILAEGKDGRRILLAGNKSGIVYALDPDHKGKTIWQQKVGRGGTPAAFSGARQPTDRRFTRRPPISCARRTAGLSVQAWEAASPRWTSRRRQAVAYSASFLCRQNPSVNGVKAKGGSINNGGAAIAGGMVFLNSGYSHHTGVIPGSVLLAFSVP
jgi:polyvinyl alcohol dehydrogenase (cytochrome)